MEEVKAYRLSDGSLEVSRAEAFRKEIDLAVKAIIKDFVNESCWNGMDKSDIIDVIFDRYDTLVMDIKTARDILVKSFDGDYLS